MIQIRIAEKDNQKRGKLFERMIRDLLERQGYEDIRLNQVEQGYELDFKARHKGVEIIGECKAHKDKIHSPDILDFFAKFTLERRRNKHIKGEFYSLSPLTGSNGAEGVLTQIKEEENILFVSYNPEEIVDQLIKKELVSASFDDIKAEFSSIIDRTGQMTDKKFVMGDKIFLEYLGGEEHLRGEYYWICLVSGYGEDAKSFLILDNTGKIPQREYKSC
jgi:hypothetical protein